MEILEYMNKSGHEQLLMCSDPEAGLKAMIALHDTTLGPAAGGTRMRAYESEEAAVYDALRLSHAMTYKCAAAGLPLGGGKAVIIADPRTQKTEALLRAFGGFVETLCGRYLTTTDVGTTTRDLEHIRQTTSHVLGLPPALGGSGDTSIMTGFGIYMGMKACAREAWGSDSLQGKRVNVQGFGKVAVHLSEHLMEDDARLLVTDIQEEALDKARDMGIDVVSPDKIMTADCDIFAPCALGGVLNGESIPRLQCRIVAGGANNQLLGPEDGEDIHRRGILYAPDYIVNAGGIINAATEVGATYSPERAREQTERIYETVGRVIGISRDEEISTARAADQLAAQRLASVRAVRKLHHPG